MKERLCPHCRGENNKCWLKREAVYVTTLVPPLEKQTLISPDGLDSRATKEATAAHKIITELRERARQMGCPNAPRVNPNYDGKGLL